MGKTLSSSCLDGKQQSKELCLQRQPDFDTQLNQPRRLFPFNFNGDPALDLLVVSSNPPNLRIVQNQGGGFDTFFVDLQGNGLIEAAAADINGDNTEDIIATLGGNLGVVINNRQDNQPLTVVPNPIGLAVTSLAIGDLDLDGDQDVVSTAGGSEQIVIWRNDGTGAFPDSEAFNIAGADVFTVFLSDMNRDNTLDILTIDRGTQSLSLFRNRSQGGVIDLEGAQRIDVAQDPVSLAAADLDQDGDNDLAVPCSGTREILLLLNQGGGDFDPPTSIEVGNGGLRDADTGDFNNDGKVDVIVTATNELLILVNDKDGEADFSLERLDTAQFNPELHDAVVADLNVDGRQDIAAISPSNGFLLTFFGSD